MINNVIYETNQSYGTLSLLEVLDRVTSFYGLSTIVLSILFLGGVQLLSIGILGEYIARIYNEVKKRPLFIVDETIGFDKSALESETKE